MTEIKPPRYVGEIHVEITDVELAAAFDVLCRHGIAKPTERQARKLLHDWARAWLAQAAINVAKGKT